MKKYLLYLPLMASCSGLAKSSTQNHAKHLENNSQKKMSYRESPENAFSEHRNSRTNLYV